MSTVAEEQVLVFPTEVFLDLGHFQGFSNKVDHYLPAILASGQLSYRPRGEMEEDPSYKQLIPYVLFRYRDADGNLSLFRYQRGAGGGEAKLRAKMSVGIGGHISTLDGSVDEASDDVYRTGMRRELDEEVAIDSAYQESCVGLINDDETPVGKVHLGVLHVFDLEQPKVHSREDDIQAASFQPLDEIAKELDGYESWSQIAVRAILDA